MAAGLVNPASASRAAKSWWPFLVALIGMALILRSNSTPYTPPVKCDADIAAANVEVVMLGASWCRFCAKARHHFTKNEITYCEYDIETTTKGATLYAENGGGGIPIIRIGDETIVGFNRTQIAAALAATPRSSTTER